MRALLIVVCLFAAFGSFGQTFYEHGIIVRTYGTQSAALQNFGALDSRQFTRAALVPLRLIENPFLFNPPDSVEWGVFLTPHDLDGDGICATDSAFGDLIPATGFNIGGCVGSYKDEMEWKLFKPTPNCNATCTTNAALTHMSTRSPARRQTAALIPLPTTDGAVYVVWRDTIEICN